jgi:type I restriction enzyme S subunit
MGFEWPWVSLADAPLEIMDGDRGTNYPSQNDFLSLGHCLFLNTGNVTTNGFNFSSCAFISVEKDSALRKGKLKRGDVVLTTRGTVGNVAYYQDDVPFEHVRINSGMVILRSEQSQLSSHFLYLFVRSNLFIQQVKSLQSGSAQPQLPIRDMKRIEMPIPSLSEQAAICEAIGSLDDRIALLRETNATLEAMAQALFKSWFVDFDPVHAKKVGRTPEGMDEATANLFPDDFEESELGLVPKGWGVQAVGDLLVPKRGKSITKTKCVEGDIPVVAGGLEPAYFHNQSNVSSPVVTISASGANAGFVRLYQQDIWASDCSFVSIEQTEAIYFWYVFLKLNQEKIYFMQQGAAQPHIYPSDLIRLHICSPKIDKLRGVFNSLVSPLFDRIGLNSTKIQTLSNLRDTLLPRLISGQLRIADADPQLNKETNS